MPVSEEDAISGQEEFLAYLKKAGIKVNRENYIALAWGEPLPEWTAELEAELPEELQDWKLFDVSSTGEFTYKGPGGAKGKQPAAAAGSSGQSNRTGQGNA